MRRGHWVIALLMVWALSLPSNAQTPPQPQSDRAKLGYLGPIHLVRERIAYYSLVNGEMIAQGTQYTNYASFTESGSLIYRSGSNLELIRKPDPIFSRTIHSATENKTVYVETDKNGAQLRKQVYYYDVHNDLVEIVYYSTKDQMTERDTYLYDDQHRLILMNSYNELNKLVGQTQYEYDLGGKIKSQLNKTPNGKVQKKHTYEYTKNKISRYIISEPSDYVLRHHLFILDATGNKQITREDYAIESCSGFSLKPTISTTINGDILEYQTFYNSAHLKISSQNKLYETKDRDEVPQPTSGKNLVATFIYDGKDRIVEEPYTWGTAYHVYTDTTHTFHYGKRPNGTLPAPFITWEYDSNGNLIHYKKGIHEELFYEYDEYGNLISIKGMNEEIYYEYDEHGNLISTRNPKKNIVERYVYQDQFDQYGNWIQTTVDHYYNDKLFSKVIYSRKIIYYTTTPVEDFVIHEAMDKKQ